MKAKRTILSLFAVVLILAACAPTATPTEAPAPTPTEVPPAEEITINFWHQESPERRVAFLQTLLDKFHEENPNITVVQEAMGWDEQYVKLLSALEAGNPPEVVWGTTATVVTLQDVDAIYPVTDIVKELDELYHYIPAHRDVLFWDGEYWAIPVFGLSYNLWYRADWFKEAGLEPPKNWDELLAAAEALNDPPDHWGIALPASDQFFCDQVFFSFLASNNGDAISPDNELILNTPAVVETLEFYAKLNQYAPPDNTAWMWGDAEQAFAQGKAAMLPIFNAVMQYQAAGNPPENLGVVANFPPSSDGRAASVGYTLEMSLLTDDPVKLDAIMKWIHFMFKPENYGHWAAEFEPGLFLPLTEAGLKAESYWAHPVVADFEPQIKVVLDGVENDMHYGFVPGVKPHPGTGPLTNGVVLGKMVQKVVLEGMSPEEAAAWGQTFGEELRGE